MKIAVYTIAKNEEQFVEKWYKAAKDADYLLIADTGSTDNTIKKAKKLGINVVSISVKPWRFDNARNASLAYIPDDVDYCIALDMDEVLVPGWRDELEKALEQGITRPRYKYTWSWHADGTPGLQYGGDKIHTRHGYRWKHPVHEVLVADRMIEKQGWFDIEIHHFQDRSKARSQYLPLLELAVREDPTDDRNAYYYARELFFHGEFLKATEEFKRHLALPTARWGAERAASYRYLAKCNPAHVQEYLEKAIAEDERRREPKVELALYAYGKRDWELCYSSAISAIEIESKPLDYLCEDFAWGELVYDLAAISAWNLGKNDEALKYGKIASDMKPNDQRLKKNLDYYSGKEEK